MNGSSSLLSSECGNNIVVVELEDCGVVFGYHNIGFGNHPIPKSSKFLRARRTSYLGRIYFSL